MDANAPTVVPAPPTFLPMNPDKTELRRRATERRRPLADQSGAAGAAAASLFMAAPGLAGPDPSVFAGYWPIKSEIDPRPLMRCLLAGGWTGSLPVSGPRDQPLSFREWAEGEPLESGPFGVSEPLSNRGTIRPMLLIVPLLAFDRRGHRLGYGAGYYDRTLAALRRAGSLTAVGLAFAGQEMDRLPSTEDDQPLDWVVTDKEAFEVPD